MPAAPACHAQKQSASLRPAGSICVAMLSLSIATVRIRTRLYHSLRPAFAVSCSSALALHRTPALKGFVCAASAFAGWCMAAACIRMQPRLLLPPTDPHQPHGFCYSLYLRGQNSDSPQQSLTCPRPTASLQTSLPACLH